jgi:hypothetical protein
MMVKFRNVNNLTSFSHFDIKLLVDHLLQVFLRDLALGGGGDKIADWRTAKRAGGHVPPVYMLKEALNYDIYKG